MGTARLIPGDVLPAIMEVVRVPVRDDDPGEGGQDPGALPLWSAGMDGAANRPTGARPSAAAGRITDGAAPLVGRRDALRVFGEALDASSAGSFQFLVLVGEPGAGKTRLLGELAAAAPWRGLSARRGQSAEFEQELPFGAVVDALDDDVEVLLPGLADRLGAETSALLATVLPSAPAVSPGQAPPAPGPGRDLTSRLRVYRAVR